MNEREAAVRLIPEEVLDLEVRGLGFPPGPLRRLLGCQPTVLAFLRHFG
jgi:hypothetical protein